VKACSKYVFYPTVRIINHLKKLTHFYKFYFFSLFGEIWSEFYFSMHRPKIIHNFLLGVVQYIIKDRNYPQIQKLQARSRNILLLRQTQNHSSFVSFSHT